MSTVIWSIKSSAHKLTEKERLKPRRVRIRRKDRLQRMVKEEKKKEKRVNCLFNVYLKGLTIFGLEIDVREKKMSKEKVKEIIFITHMQDTSVVS